MIEKDIICVVCPSSCRIHVCGDASKVTEMTGYTCKRGMEYAKDEFLAPKRTLATLVKANGYTAPVIPVRSSGAVPKELIFECMDEIKKAYADPPFYMGKVVIENILGTGVDIVLSNC